MVVIESALRVIDYLIKLLNSRKQNQRQEFEALVEPLFKDAEAVAKDYFQVFSELIQRIQKSRDLPSIITWLEERRAAYRPVRIKIREYLLHFSHRSLDGLGNEIKPDSKGIQDKFVTGIQAMLGGGLSLVEEGHIGMPGKISSHTLLDIFIWDATKPFDRVRDTLLNRAKRQEDAIHKAWKDVVDGYMERKAKVYGLKSKKKI